VLVVDRCVLDELIDPLFYTELNQ